MAIIRVPKAPRKPRKNVRAETTSIRLDPRLRYFCELACIKQRRSLNSFIEYAIETTLNNVNIYEGGYNEAPVSISSVADQLWDVDESDRFAKLALRYPELLSYDQQILWKLIREMPGMWRGHYDNRNEWSWKVVEATLIFERLREHWQILQEIARGEALKTQLPKWIWSRRKLDTEPDLPDNPFEAPPMDDEDIPF